MPVTKVGLVRINDIIKYQFLDVVEEFQSEVSCSFAFTNILF